MPEGVCDHCLKLTEVSLIGKWSLCINHKDLKQYQEKKPKNYSLKRTPIKKNSEYKIPKISDRHRKSINSYTPICKKFKADNPGCVVNTEQCTGRTEDIHHSMGKNGFADDWARMNDVPLLIDVRHFIPICRRCHDYVELHPNWAKDNGFSKPRLRNNK